MASLFNFPLTDTVTNGGFDSEFPAPTVSLAGGSIPFDTKSVDFIDTEMTTFSNAQDAATGNADYIQQATDYNSAGICSGNDGVVVEFVRRKNQGSR